MGSGQGPPTVVDVLAVVVGKVVGEVVTSVVVVVLCVDVPASGIEGNVN